MSMSDPPESHRSAAAPGTVSQTFNDLSVREAVESELAWTPDVTAPMIGVSVDGGVVTLTGEVATLHERIAVVHAVQPAAGNAVCGGVLIRKSPSAALREGAGKSADR